VIFDSLKANEDGSFLLDDVLVSSGAQHQQILDYITESETPVIGAKQIRDESLRALVHDFGDGRIIQTRPQDEQNVKTAIELMTSLSMASIGWVMADNVKYHGTVEELQAALLAGQLAAMQVWADYEP